MKIPMNSKVILDLSKDIDSLWESLSGNSRTIVRKAFTDGHYLMDDKRFWALTPNRKKAKNIPGVIRTQMTRDGSIVGGAIVDFNKDMATYDLGVNVTEWLLWQIIKECKTHGIQKLNIGSTRIGSGAHFFNTHFCDFYSEEREVPSIYRMVKGFILNRISNRK